MLLAIRLSITDIKRLMSINRTYILTHMIQMFDSDQSVSGFAWHARTQSVQSPRVDRMRLVRNQLKITFYLRTKRMDLLR